MIITSPHCGIAQAQCEAQGLKMTVCEPSGSGVGVRAVCSDPAGTQLAIGAGVLGAAVGAGAAYAFAGKKNVLLGAIIGGALGLIGAG